MNDMTDPQERSVHEKPAKNAIIPRDYASVLEQIKNDVQQSQLRAAQSATKELIMLYWRIGKTLAGKVIEEGWGARTIDRLAKDLKEALSWMTGFSVRNLHYMRKFYESYTDGNFAAAVAQIPWGHNIILMDKVATIEQRLWYAQQTLENGWSRSVLGMWIESDLYSRQGKAITNFKHTIPSPQSDLAEQTLKDPYNFQFLALEKKFREKELEQGLIDHIQKFLLELGEGFAFVGRQYKVEVSGKEYFIDLLFYHLKLRFYVVVELKATEFDPRDTGQLNFYLSAIDDLLRHPDDKPTIGLLLCKGKDKCTVEYAFRDVRKPIGVADYQVKLVESLPKDLRGSLPTVEEIEAELGNSP
jgi:predicted nuclease of restriction endonuclease-like (RecB) superfamily